MDTESFKTGFRVIRQTQLILCFNATYFHILHKITIDCITTNIEKSCSSYLFIFLDLIFKLDNSKNTGISLRNSHRVLLCLILVMLPKPPKSTEIMRTWALQWQLQPCFCPPPFVAYLWCVVLSSNDFYSLHFSAMEWVEQKLLCHKTFIVYSIL